jgi:hypothetical protein
MGTSSVDVVQEIQGRLKQTGVFSAEVSHQYAVLHGAFYDTMAMRMGITLAELLEMNPLPKISAETLALDEFRGWFESSHVKDSQGKPMVVYHGTQASFSEFDEEMQGTTVYSEDIGFFFTNDPVEAGRYATLDWDKESPQPNVMPVFLSMKNPKVVLLDSDSPYENPAIWYDNEGREAIADAQEAGHDGLVVRDVRADMLLDGGVQRTLFVALRPDQIRSAIKYREAASRYAPSDLKSVRFMEWFAGSKAVQQNGAPLLLYHGTGADTGNEFLPGTYFTPRPDVADIYAKAPTRQVDGSGPNVSPVYVSIKNPYVHDDQAVGENLSRAVLGKRGSMEQVREKLIADGYDGIVLKNYFDLGGLQEQYVIFNSAQVKSAIGNDGSFDSRDPNILHQSVWHGSPHEFDEFRMDKVGTGEGAKSFGFGLYFTETKEVAIGYANMPSFKRAVVENPQVIKGMGPGARGLLGRIEKLGSVQGALNEAQELLASMRASGSFPSVQVDLADEIDLVDEFGKSLQITPTGIKSNLYKVEISDKYVSNFLNWDKPLSHQPAEVRKILASLAPDHYGPDSDDYDESEQGQTIYHRLSSMFGGDKQASEALSAAGIKGIKYLDGNSRDEGAGTSNMVVFDERIVTVTQKNGDEVVPAERDVFMQSASPSAKTVVKILYRGTNNSGERIKGGIAPGALFATPYEDVARSYAGSGGVIERIGLLSGAKILTEGTREFAKLTARRPGKLLNTMRAGENLKTACDDAVEKARAAGYDGVEFNSFRDLGTVILDTEKVIRGYTPPEEFAAAQDAFSDWFGASKVVNQQGKPMVVYHGTGNLENLDRFDPNFAGQGTDQIGSGFYFTTDANDASGYAATSKNSRDGNQKIGGIDSPGVAPVYLSIKNPIVVNGQSLNDTDVVLTHSQAVEIIKRAPGIRDLDESPIGNFVDIWRAGGVSEKMISDVAKLYSGQLMVALEGDIFRGNSEAYRKALHAVLGYDGVVKDFGDGRKHYVAWFPEQIKSAIGNRGTYSPNDPSILNQHTGGRGFYNPKTIEIGLLKDADASTFIHESAHFFLDSMARLASLPQAPQEIRDDFDILLRWFSVDGSDQQERLRAWLDMDLNGQRDGHEKFARGFESYAAAGNAPSPELEGMFAQFSEWLSEVCHLMGDELPADVQGAMGRLLAAAVDGEMESSDQSDLRDRLYG